MLYRLENNKAYITHAGIFFYFIHIIISIIFPKSISWNRDNLKTAIIISFTLYL